MKVEKQYDSGVLAENYADKSKGNESLDLGRIFLREQIQYIDRKSVIVDVGCGDGIDLVAYREMGFTNISGVDPSEKLLERARKSLGEEVFLKIGTFSNLPLADSSVDLVISRHALHYSNDIKGSLKEVARVLKVGGKLMIVMSHPMADSLEPKDELGNITITLFNGTVPITFPQHTLSGIFSQSFLGDFHLDKIHEYVGNERDTKYPTIPSAICFVATRI